MNYVLFMFSSKVTTDPPLHFFPTYKTIVLSLCFVHAVCSVLDTWYYSTHDRCAVFLIPYRIVVLTIHCFHCRLPQRPKSQC